MPASPALHALAALAVSCQLAACQKVPQATVDQTAGQVDIEQADDSTTITTGEGEMRLATARAGGSLALPDGFPADVHLPARHTVQSAMDMAGMKMVNLDTPEAAATVSAAIERGMQAHGWKREMAMQAGGGSTFVYSKDTRQAVYQVMQADDGEGTQLAIRTGDEG